MQFKHPELLYALILLLIPIFIHLFQLRRFQKTQFTNVAFLKKITIQTRKSSQLKKWLTLLARLFALAFIILAFAQPFTASKTALTAEKETVLYIDNSYSMQAKGDQGPLLERALQDIYTSNAGNESLSWFTNNTTYTNVSADDFKKEILKTTFSQKQLQPAEVLLKANQLFSKNSSSIKQLIYISDFQIKTNFPPKPSNIEINTVQLKPNSDANFAIDSVYISAKTGSGYQLKVKVSSNKVDVKSIPISLYKGETLLAKTAASFAEGVSSTVLLDIESIESIESFKGKIEIIDSNLLYDNALYFSINRPSKIKVLIISDDNSGYLERLFNTPDFDFMLQTSKQLNYNEIPNQNFILLNSILEIPPSLISAIKAFSDAGGSLLILPSTTQTISEYNPLLSTLELGRFGENLVQEKKITKISFSHPLFENVFEKQVVNFQFPKVNSYFSIVSNATPVLSFEDGSPFLLQKNASYLATAAITTENSNFQNSPLIVPTFYNIAIQSLPLPRLYYTIGNTNFYAAAVQLKSDEIVTLKGATESFIPLQQTKANQVEITTTDDPAIAGNYSLQKDENYLQDISYNYNRNESELNYANAGDWKDTNTFKTIETVFETMAEANAINSFWKWFALVSFLFLVLEIIFLKFLK